MAKERKFKSNTGGHVQVFYGHMPAQTLELHEKGTYTTSNKAEIDALQASPEVTEVKESKRK